MSELEPGRTPDGKQILWLKRLVTVLTFSMLAGTAILVALALSVFLRSETPDATTWPGALALPQNESLTALTRAENWLIAVTQAPDGTARVHILDASGGKITQTIDLP